LTLIPETLRSDVESEAIQTGYAPTKNANLVKGLLNNSDEDEDKAIVSSASSSDDDDQFQSIKNNINAINGTLENGNRDSIAKNAEFKKKMKKRGSKTLAGFSVNVDVVDYDSLRDTMESHGETDYNKKRPIESNNVDHLLIHVDEVRSSQERS
jgi:hypothetical protein